MNHKPSHISKAEHIGDAILSLVVREFVYNIKGLPHPSYGILCGIFCCNDHLQEVCERFNIKPRWHRGYKRHGDHMEYLIYEIYKSQGLEVARQFIHQIVLHPDLINDTINSFR